MAAKYTLGNRLVEVRVRNGWTQGDAARWCGITPAHLSHFEADRRNPSVENLRRLALGLRVSADWLIGIDGAQKRGRAA